ncbi:beta-N-acetylhexosaminidase [Flavivirga rizhaonensis]|uniref:beta-N-acetylhexosaminidase n=1 Tax=Flavivirga rizhaonensis TaxID=2559571 RepID=A0A4S1E2N4_9FLAO|nr:family 20 glycosylhydrolase [Flavivirga rizhaonensis]TGV04613.1 hypothetical protein EM932_00360 [Flavivirga rizhaonensis]
MKFYTIYLALLIPIVFIQCKQTATHEINIIPKPHEYVVSKGTFKINNKTKIVVLNNSLTPLAHFLTDQIYKVSGLTLNVAAEYTENNNNIILGYDNNLGEEEYKLIIEKKVHIEASNYNSAAMAAATLMQLINITEDQVGFPNISISDKPDYKYRSVMLDLARFWHPMETVKEIIDLLWFYKIKYLHLHLSDNRRFTFPLDAFPNLKTVNEDGSREYYTLEELEYLVEYARKRGVTIIPEIDLPGHSTQLWSKYPEVFGSIDPKTNKPKTLYVINMAKEETYKAVELIINQLAKVFYTSPYIHIGGDEVYLQPIKELPEYKTYCKKQGLKAALAGNANELFCHFINRLNGMVKKTGKKTIVWEGFHNTGAGDVQIDKDITVIVWNTTYNHPENLLNNGFEIINSTWIPWYQVEAMNFAPNPEIAYDWDLGDWTHWEDDIEDIQLSSKKGILGAQISFWEQNYNKVIEVLKDRVPVLSERLWNNENSTDYINYHKRFISTNSTYDKLFMPIEIKGTQLINKEGFHFEDKTDIIISAKGKGYIKYAYSNQWGLPSEYLTYTEPFEIKNSGLITAQLFDESNKAIGYPVQQYITKIEPIYNYKVYESTHEANKIPDFSTSRLLREGVTGKMNNVRLKEINRDLFAKVKKEGHIDTRFEGLYNPYGLELLGNLEIPSDGSYQWQLQTWDGLAELYIDGKLICKGENFKNEPEFFTVNFKEGNYPFQIKYFYKNIQNQLSILYRKEGDGNYNHFEELVVPLK